MAKTKEQSEVICCTPKHLVGDLLSDAADLAHQINPLNRPNLEHIANLAPPGVATHAYIAVLTTKYWRTGGVKLSVGFLDNPPTELRAKILQHMNAWGKTANVAFAETTGDAQVRISRGSGGYWSYIGTDILMIDKNKQTMNLEGFTMNTPDSEFYRVVRHETGHTLGCPHEHMRADLVAMIDEAKAIAFYGATQGWTPEQVRAQVLTPLDPKTVWGTPNSDRTSIMCYQIPGTITKSGLAIPGGLDIDPLDYDFIATVYPKPASIAPVAHDSGAPMPTTTAPTPTVAAAHPHPAAHTHPHHHHCPDCVDVALRNGERLTIPLSAAEAQVRRLVAALTG